jgi:Tfp pilus assembly protein PilN
MSWGTPWAQRQGPPRIDLLPRQLIEQRIVRRQRGGIGAAFLLLLAVLGLWYVMEQRQLGEAERELDQERAVGDDLRTRRAGLQPLADLEAQIAAAEQLRAQVYARELRFSTVMRDISAIIPDDVWLTSMSATFSDAAGAAATGGTAGATGTAGGPARPGRPAPSPRAARGPARQWPPSPSGGRGWATSTSAGSCGRWPAGRRRVDSRCT